MISLHLRRIATDKIRVFWQKKWRTDSPFVVTRRHVKNQGRDRIGVGTTLNERMYLIVFQFITEFIDFFKELMTKSTINPRRDRSHLDFEPIWSKYMISAP